MQSDHLPPSLAAAIRAIRQTTAPFDVMREQLLADSTGVRAMLDLANTQHRLQGLVPDFAFLDDMRSAGEAIAAQTAQLGLPEPPPSIVAQAQAMAEATRGLALPEALETFRTPFEQLSQKLLALAPFDALKEPGHLEAFLGASALADQFAVLGRVGSDLSAAATAFLGTALPAFQAVDDYCRLLDAAGLRALRLFRVRQLTEEEKREIFEAQLEENAEPEEAKQAKALVHPRELVLRNIIYDVMGDAYGDDWPEERLPLCGCNDLLGRWRKLVGDVLEHADFAHYAKIMTHPEHFAEAFQAGFEDLPALSDMLERARQLRVRSHHPYPFTAGDLRELTVAWLFLEKGLVALSSDYAFDYSS